MSRRHSSSLNAFWLNPLRTWAELARQSNEMLLASAEVIARRSGRIARAGATPDASDRREMRRMVAEKAHAAQESALAVGTQCAKLFSTAMLQTSAQIHANTAWLCGTTLRAAYGKPALKPRRALARSKAATDGGARAAAKIAKAGLAPYHRRATANVKRLRKR